jgi:voltage-gated potassium channel
MKEEFDAPEDLANHWIVCGAGRFGLRAACVLALEEQLLVIVDHDPRTARRAALAGALLVVEDALDEGVLVRAGIRRARGVICALPTVRANGALVVLARRHAPGARVVARADDMIESLALHGVGADATLSPHSEGLGRKLRRAVRRGTSPV